MPGFESTLGVVASRPMPLRVLVADDDRDTANMLALLLRDEGHDVHTALRGGPPAPRAARPTRAASHRPFRLVERESGSARRRAARLRPLSAQALRAGSAACAGQRFRSPRARRSERRQVAVVVRFATPSVTE